MKSIRDILRSKGAQVWSVAPKTTIFDSLRLMAEKEIGAVLVLEEGRLVGIFSERDYARKVVLKGKSSKETAVADVMTPRVVCVSPERTLDECMAIMTEKRIRHLPVCEGNRLVGLVSIGDVVKGVISDQQFMIDQLEHYILGR